jgi:DNA-binding beta-propeller fold protein YncE
LTRRAALSRLMICAALLFLFTALPAEDPPDQTNQPNQPNEPDETGRPAVRTTVQLKSAPAESAFFFNGRELKAERAAAGIRTFLLEGEGIIRIAAAGYRSREFRSGELAGLLSDGLLSDGLLKDGLLQIKLERDIDLPLLLQEIPTGNQPKSAYFSPEGDRIFVSLLNDPGIDVFRLERGAGTAVTLRRERRLFVPTESGGVRQIRGFVEALCVTPLRELWVSNMTENKIHVWDLDTLEYKTGFSSGGKMPKVLVLSPDSNTVAVSNWLSLNVVFFNAAEKTQLAVIPAGGTPRGMAFDPTGALLYTAIFDGPVIAVIDAAQKKVIRRIRLYEGAGAARHIIYKDGKLFVSDMYRGTVNILDAASGRLMESRRVGPNINTIVLSPDGTTIAASSRGRNNPEDYTRPGPDFGSVTLLHSADLSEQTRIWGRNQPTGLAISPDGTLMAFTDFLDRNLELYRIR